jgi:hypothetical protein
LVSFSEGKCLQEKVPLNPPSLKKLLILTNNLRQAVGTSIAKRDRQMILRRPDCERMVMNALAIPATQAIESQGNKEES